MQRITTLLSRGAAPLLVLALAACTSEPIPTTTGPTDPPVQVPTDPNVPRLGNEPAGFTTLVDNDWAGFLPTAPTVNQVMDGWTRYQNGNTGRAVTDASAPATPNVLEILFSGRQGVGPEHLQIRIPAGYSRLYLSVPVWTPPGYVGSSSGVQKLFHLWAPSDANSNLTTGGSMVVPALFGTGTNPLRAQIRIQGASVTATQRTSFNLGNAPVQRGQWYLYEYLLVLNTGANADGQAHLWVNGAKVMTATNIVYSGAKRAKNWTFLQLNPTYGGTGTVPPGVKLRYGQIHVSVAR